MKSSKNKKLKYKKTKNSKKNINIRIKKAGALAENNKSDKLNGNDHCLHQGWQKCFPNSSKNLIDKYQKTPPKNIIQINGYTDNVDKFKYDIDQFLIFIDKFEGKNIEHSWLGKFSLKKQKLEKFKEMKEKFNNISESVKDFSTIKNEFDIGIAQSKILDIYLDIDKLFHIYFTGKNSDENYDDLRKKITFGNFPIGLILYDNIKCDNNNYELINIGFLIIINGNEVYQLTSHSFLLDKNNENKYNKKARTFNEINKEINEINNLLTSYGLSAIQPTNKNFNKFLNEFTKAQGNIKKEFK